MLATTGAFLASALFHEYIVYLLFQHASEDRRAPRSNPGTYLSLMEMDLYLLIGDGRS